KRVGAVEALLALGERGGCGPAERAALVDLAVDWVARPALRGLRDEDEAHALLTARLPEFGEAIVEPVVSRLLAGRFTDANHGVRLLLGLDRTIAVAALGRVVLTTPRPRHAILTAASGGVRDSKHVGCAEGVRVLLHPERPGDVRRDGASALAEERGEIALPFLEAALLVRPKPASTRPTASPVGPGGPLVPGKGSPPVPRHGPRETSGENPD